MGTRIDAVKTAHSESRLLPRGARRLADDAAKGALAAAGRQAAEVDLLINAGVYREDNLAEPALASMIQEDIGANAGHPPVDDHHGTFSFDIANGGAGAVTAFELLDGFLRSGTITLGLVVTSDAPPTEAEGFPYASTGAAAVLSRDKSDRGFVDFSFETFDELEDLYESHVSWHPREHHLPLMHTGRNVLGVHLKPGFEDAFITCAVEASRRFLSRHDLSPDTLDLVVPSQFPQSLPHALGERLALRPDCVAVSPVAGTHTAGPLFAYEAALRSGRVDGARNVLFVGVGAGVNVGLALYRP